MKQTKQNTSEMHILGACMVSEDAYELARGLTCEHFGNLAHHPIWKAIRSLRVVGPMADVVSVAGLLGERKLLRSVGGPTYLLDLIEYIPPDIDITDDVLRLLDRGRGPECGHPWH